MQTNTQLSFWWKAKSSVNLGEENQAKRSIYLRTSSLLSVLLRIRSAHRLSSQHFAAVSTPNIAELVPSGFFLSTTMVFAAVQTHFARKNTIFMLIGSCATGKEISSIIKNWTRCIVFLSF